MKRFLYSLFRPIYRPLLRPLRHRLTSASYYEHPEMQLPPAFDTVQLEVERRLHRYLHCDPKDIRKIAIVGAHVGGEIGRISNFYPNASFDCFEPSPRFLPELRQRWGVNPKVKIHGVALSETRGKARFYELSMPGNGSLLEPDVDRWASFNEWSDKKSEFYEVETKLLDDYFGTGELDLLWVDVQGAEMAVLNGAVETLKRTKAIFLEITLAHGPYKGGALFEGLNTFLVKSGFTCCGQGVDPWSFTGGALWIKDVESKICQEHPGRKS